MDVFKPGEEIQIFDSYNRLSSIFPCIALPFKAEVPYVRINNFELTILIKAFELI